MTDPENIFIPMPGKRAFEEVSSQIKNLIFQGILKPNDRLPSETDLATDRQFIEDTSNELLENPKDDFWADYPLEDDEIANLVFIATTDPEKSGRKLLEIARKHAEAHAQWMLDNLDSQQAREIYESHRSVNA